MDRFSFATVTCALATALSPISATSADCAGNAVSGLGGVSRAWVMSDGGIAAFAKMNINIDGYNRAYHPQNAAGGALIHLCNAGKVYLADGTSYHGSESNSTCTGRFMSDVARIGAAGWKDPSIGAVNWYGILGTESVRVAGRTVTSVVPVVQTDGSGFYVSPTALADFAITDKANQSRYVNALRVPAAVVPESVLSRGITMGGFGVAYDPDKKIAVPFVIGDAGPRIGEGSVALARLVAGHPLKDEISRNERFVGQVDRPNILWIFFKTPSEKYDSKNEAATIAKANAAFSAWGGNERLTACARAVPRN
ncbi:hypothetical protein [Achromobacter piechaudii]|uniref:Fungal chitosanase n=1 Tax=Achromobacter piechaudii TaxID=72556 RepID=A0ABN7F382_9BURK|nr:hypothetical protein [Achromobacter piechaudii]CAB3722493.1 hypothetical protein LMG1873_04041 [Achromobacter piechaudii]CAB3893753.1 hypothetical protein LMG2828_04125 [Achromobacter piechaudii]CAB3957483.1 hypothetical protein LMG6103_05236 [Achromobacter piechaudii]